MLAIGDQNSGGGHQQCSLGEGHLTVLQGFLIDRLKTLEPEELIHL